MARKRGGVMHAQSAITASKAAAKLAWQNLINGAAWRRVWREWRHQRGEKAAIKRQQQAAAYSGSVALSKAARSKRQSARRWRRRTARWPAASASTAAKWLAKSAKSAGIVIAAA